MKHKPIKINVKEIAYHRNGIGGEPFHVVLFTMRDTDSETTAPDSKPIIHNMMAVVFEQPYQVSVFDHDKLKQDIIGFGYNSWRGEVYERQLRQAIARWWNQK